MRHHANRGMALERVIELSAKQYANKGIAQIHKIPTPMKMPSKYSTKQHAFYSGKSTVDFLGGYNGKYQAFDVKEAKAPRFPADKLQPHQLQFLINAHQIGGDAYIIVHFTTENEMYKIWITQYVEFYENTDRKSIPIDWCRENCDRVVSRQGIVYDFLGHFTKAL